MSIRTDELDPIIIPRLTFPKKRGGHGKKTREVQKMYRIDPCAYCGREGGTLDHIIPKSKGGAQENNVTGACQSCNVQKADKDLLSFLLEIKS